MTAEKCFFFFQLSESETTSNKLCSWNSSFPTNCNKHFKSLKRLQRRKGEEEDPEIPGKRPQLLVGSLCQEGLLL